MLEYNVLVWYLFFGKVQITLVFILYYLLSSSVYEDMHYKYLLGLYTVKMVEIQKFTVTLCFLSYSLKNGLIKLYQAIKFNYKIKI